MAATLLFLISRGSVAMVTVVCLPGGKVERWPWPMPSSSSLFLEEDGEVAMTSTLLCLSQVEE